MYCTRCGQKLPTWARFCSACGSPVAGADGGSPTLSGGATLGPSPTLSGGATLGPSPTLSGGATLGPSPTLSGGQTLTVGGFVRVRGGRFRAGSPPGERGRWPDETLREQAVDDFLLMATPVTRGAWRARMGEPPGAGADDLPVAGVSWEAARSYCDALSREQGLTPFYREGGDGFRLPREAEWEYACRAGSATPFWWGEPMRPERAPHDARFPLSGSPRSALPSPRPVGALVPNPWGLRGMHGGVWEWCEDLYEGGPERVARGGSWGSPAELCRAAARGRFAPEHAGPTVGLRLARDLSLR